MKVVGEKEIVKTLRRDWTKIIFPNTTDRENGERFTTTGFYKQWNTESEGSKLGTWQCSGEKVGGIPRNRQRGLMGPCATQRVAVPLHGGHLVEAIHLPTGKVPADLGEQPHLLVFEQRCQSTVKPGTSCVL